MDEHTQVENTHRRMNTHKRTNKTQVDKRTQVEYTNVDKHISGEPPVTVVNRGGLGNSMCGG